MFRNTSNVHRAPLKRALLIGIDYIGTPIRLNGCINDVMLVRQHLTTTANYSPLNVRTMTDNGFRPTMSNIMNAINWFVSGLRSGDTLFFHYSGHGTSIIDRNNDEIDGRDEAIVPLDYNTRGVISDDWIFINLIKRIPSGVTLYAFFDCCCSGTITDIRYNIRHLVQPKKTIRTPVTSYISNDWHNNYQLSIEGKGGVAGNIFVFSGCLDHQVAVETINKNNQIQGAFTKILLKTLTDNNNTIKIIDFNKELNCRLFYSGYNRQNSQLSISNINLIDHNCSI